ncbi:hypothetical protein EV356DRAFT_512513 [Viridothelium virens]|uniref:Uncharacterized protein n=1 Tax=Viridothelium virens TaxID=1048519 RepID=A0A6A6HH16_VIRVR|nr:hypothetical protein EV356DRAFT_512513 [Viridothelium virens]
METTYWVEGKGKPQTAILRVNRQIRREALPLLYSRHRFGFDTHVEALPPFIRDLTAEARNCIKSVAMTKRAAPFAKDYDCAEWANACKCIATMLPALEELKLCVIACKPSREGWHDIEPIEKEDMERMIQEYSFEWVTDLLQIKGLKKLDIQPQVQKCMSPGSNAMFHWIRFSKSIASSFTDVVRGMMVGD